MDKQFLEHISLAPKISSKTNLDIINQDNFDFKRHFTSDKIVQKGNWWVVEKNSPWSLLDCMIVNPSPKVRSSFNDYSTKEIENLFNLCAAITEVLQANPRVRKIIVGANINHPETILLEKTFQRLHIHTLGFTGDEMKKMKVKNLAILEQDTPGTSNLLFDPLTGRFQKVLKPSFTKLISKFSQSKLSRDEHGLRVTFSKGFSLLKDQKFIRLIIETDGIIKEYFPEIAYSLVIYQDSNHLILKFAPRSVFGKGVLEASGIVLKRKPGKLTAAQKKEKLAFFKAVEGRIDGKS